MRWAIIGVGNMGEALARGLARAGAGELLLVDPRPDMEAVARAVGGTVARAADAVREADVVVLAVKPQTMPDALREVGHARGVVVSIAAGVRLATLEAAFAPGTEVMRAMPNTPCLVGAGASAFARGSAASERGVAIARAMLESVGIAVEVPEEQMDAVTALSGSGPAYVFAMIEAMVAGGVAAGLSAEDALALARQTMLGASRLAAETGTDPAELRRRVTSPGGTTAAALAKLGELKWSDALVAAIVAARDRGRELGR